MREESLLIDPVAMNIVNRIAPGTSLDGTFEFNGGLLVEGNIRGNVVVKGGPLILMQKGLMVGEVLCDGDAILLGSMWEMSGSEGTRSEIHCQGTAFVGSSFRARANLLAKKIDFYEGALVDGNFRTYAPSETNDQLVVPSSPPQMG